ncbi:hypothetical protein JW968_07125 [Candidatus Woesearchaeota archaeon]|nr:hypothetical protein [Candidatus Woesearchaeota archaeon]
MRDITAAEMEIVLTIAKSPERHYNANSISKKANITPMGALKILKRLEKEGVLKSSKIGQATIYRISNAEYAKRYVSLMLSREALHAPPRIRRWITELRKIRNADIIILFGSVLRKPDPNDIDALLITDKRRFRRLQKEVNEINKVNPKKIHPLYQTSGEIQENVKKEHKPILDAIKGILVTGEDQFIRVYHESRKE